MPFYGLEKTGRKRNKNVAFRVNDEEWKYLNELISVSELNKQQYYLSKLLDREITIYGNPKTYKNLKKLLIEYSEKIDRYINENKKLDSYELEILLHITEMLSALSQEKNVCTIIGKEK